MQLHCRNARLNSHQMGWCLETPPHGRGYGDTAHRRPLLWAYASMFLLTLVTDDALLLLLHNKQLTLSKLHNKLLQPWASVQCALLKAAEA